MTEPTLIVLCGMPGAGKSTWAAKQHGVIVISCDAVREGESPIHVFAAAHDRLHTLLTCTCIRDFPYPDCPVHSGRAAATVIFDACSLQPFARSRLLHIGRAAGARCELVFFCTPMLTCAARNALRKQPARADWIDLRSQARLAYQATQHEGWALITYLPDRDPFM